MNKEVIHALMTATTLRDALDVLADDDVFFSIDQGEFDEDIVQSCEDLLKTGRLSAYWADAEGDLPGGTHIRYGDKVLRCPHTDAPVDRHITIRTLNQILAPDYEVRLCIDSDDVDNLTFLPLATADWGALERKHGPQLRRRFYRIEQTPRLFVDDLDVIKPPELASRKLDAAAKKRLRTLVRNQKEAGPRNPKKQAASSTPTIATSNAPGSDPGPPPRSPTFSQWSNMAPVHPQIGAVVTPIATIGTIIWAIMEPDAAEYYAYPLVLAPIMTIVVWGWLLRYRTLARNGAAVLGRIMYVRQSNDLKFAASPRVGYAYEVNGRERKGHIQLPQKPKGGLESGMPVWVIYDIRNPQKSAMWGLYDKT